MNKKRERTVVIIAAVGIVLMLACALLVVVVLFFGVAAPMRLLAPAGSGGAVAAMPTAVAPASGAPAQTQATDTGWQTYTAKEMGLSLDYPKGWYVHSAGKALQITPNAQPTWSSFFDPDEPHGGPTFDLMHNLNRTMGPTPLAEVENLVASYGAEAEIETISPPMALPAQPEIVTAVYRFTVDGDEKVLLVGAAVNPLPDSPQPVMAMTGLVNSDAYVEYGPVFENILRSLQPTSTAPTGQE